MGSAERHDFDYLSKLRPRDGSVDLQKVTTQYGVLIVAGPHARDVLQKVTDADLSNKAFPWLSGKVIDVGAAHARALRVNFVGELGWELHHPIEMQNYIFDLLMEAGRPYGIRPFGMRAMDTLRLEKSYRLIPRELSIEYAALESGLDRFVHPNKGGFIGRDGLVAWQQRGFQNRFVTLEVQGVTDADARGSEPVPGARHGQAGAGRNRQRARHPHLRAGPPGHRGPRVALRPGQPAPAGMRIAPSLRGICPASRSPKRRLITPSSSFETEASGFSSG
jgi:dimethylglycine dehydrogenase